MPNQYSHALVFSNHQVRGLGDLHGPQVPQQPQSEYVTSTRPSTAPSPQRPTSSRLTASPRSTSPRRIRLKSPSPPPLPTSDPSAHPHLRSDTNSSIVTQVWAPKGEVPVPTASMIEEDRRVLRTASQSISSRRLKYGRSSEQAEIPVHTNPSQSYAPSPSISKSADRFAVGLEGHDSRSLHSPRPSTYAPRRLSNETAIFCPDPLSTPSPIALRRSVMEPAAPGYLPRRPPSPPLTPDHRQSFSLGSCLDSTPPLPARSTAVATSTVHHPQPATSGSSSTHSTSESPLGSPTPEVARPTSTSGATSKRQSCVPSISTRTSSLKATTFAQFSDTHSPESASTTSPNSSNPPVSFEPETDFFADLESLPGDVFADFGRPDFGDGAANAPSEFPAENDYDVLPWEDTNYRDSIPNVLREQPFDSSTRASSFDSAAPPPIALIRQNNALADRRNRASGIIPDRSRPGHAAKQYPPPPSLVSPHKPPKKTRKSLTSVFHARPNVPLSIPYFATTPGKPPARVAVPRPTAPSIPALFPNYKGSWPPEYTPVKPTRNRSRSRSKTRPPTATPSRSSSASAGPHQYSPMFPDPLSNPVTPQQASYFCQNGPAPRVSISDSVRLTSNGTMLSTSTVITSAPRSRNASVGAVVGSRRPSTSGSGSQRRRSWFNTDTLDRTFGGLDTRRGRI